MIPSDAAGEPPIALLTEATLSVAGAVAMRRG
jgi:hypothetical protein